MDTPARAIDSRCFHCGGAMLPSSYMDEPAACILCNRSNQPQPTHEEMIARTKAKILELVALPQETPVRGRPRRAMERA